MLVPYLTCALSCFDAVVLGVLWQQESECWDVAWHSRSVNNGVLASCNGSSDGRYPGRSFGGLGFFGLSVQALECQIEVEATDA